MPDSQYSQNRKQWREISRLSHGNKLKVPHAVRAKAQAFEHIVLRGIAITNIMLLILGLFCGFCNQILSLETLKLYIVNTCLSCNFYKLLAMVREPL